MHINWPKLLAWSGTACVGAVFWIAVFFLASCGDRGAPPLGGGTGGAGALDPLGSLGSWLVIGGGAALTLAVVGRFVFPAFGTLCLVLGECGAGAVASGACFRWLASHPWVLGASLAGVVVVFVVRHRRHICRWLHIGPVPAPAPPVAPAKPEA